MQRCSKHAGLPLGCRRCRACDAAQWRADNPDRCRAYARRYYAKHVAKLRAKAAEYRKLHPDKRQTAVEKYRTQNIENLRTKAREEHRKNPVKYCALSNQWKKANPGHVRATTKAWREENPARVVATRQRRRALELAAPGRGVSARDWARILAGSLGLCAYCNERKPLTVDHIEPLALHGAHEPENVVAACKPCNSSKNDTPLLIWLAKKAWARQAASTLTIERAA